MMKKKGFTLIELVVVVIIIGILAAIALPAYNRLVEKSRKAEAFATLKAILDSQKRHALEFGTYADVFDDLDINVTDPGKYFDFRLRTNPDPNNSNIDENMAVATRLEPWDAYRIRIHETGRFYEWVP